MAVIYGLFDPRNPIELEFCRYIGKTKSKPGHRLRQHICDARKGGERYVRRWIRSVLRDEIRPVIEVLEEVPDEGWQQTERDWITWAKAIGCRLTNATDGGEGNDGFVPTAETRELMRLAKLGKKQTDEAKRNSIEGTRLARLADPTIVQRAGESVRQYWIDHPEELEAVGRKHQAWWDANPEFRIEYGQKMRAFAENNPGFIERRNAAIREAKAKEDKSPLMCDRCDRGPFKGPTGLKSHIAQIHNNDQ